MRIGLDNALGIHPDALNLRAQRTEVLARNIANADTPGFKSRDFDFHAILQTQTAARNNATHGLTQTAVARTHSNHLADTNVSLQGPDLQYRMPLMPSLDGNTVEAQVEQAKFAENALQFQASLQFTNSKFRGLMTAIKGE